jgi:hypothetical protein
MIYAKPTEEQMHMFKFRPGDLVHFKHDKPDFFRTINHLIVHNDKPAYVFENGHAANESTCTKILPEKLMMLRLKQSDQLT